MSKTPPPARDHATLAYACHMLARKRGCRFVKKKSYTGGSNTVASTADREPAYARHMPKTVPFVGHAAAS